MRLAVLPRVAGSAGVAHRLSWRTNQTRRHELLLAFATLVLLDAASDRKVEYQRGHMHGVHVVECIICIFNADIQLWR